MFETGSWSAADVAAVLANPFYAVELNPELCARRGPLLLDEDIWIERNAELIAVMGSSAWLHAFLRVLQGLEGEPGAPRYPMEVWMLINPATSVQIHESFAEPHATARTEDEWVVDNARLINVELGVVPYLKSLLAILRGATVQPGGTFFGFRAGSEAVR